MFSLVAVSVVLALIVLVALEVVNSFSEGV